MAFGSYPCSSSWYRAICSLSRLSYDFIFCLIIISEDKNKKVSIMADIKKLEQKRQEALDKANRMKKQIDKALNGQKFVLGGMLMAIAEHEPDRIPQILADIDKYVTRKADISRLEGFKSEIGNNVPKDTP